jgi:hypothetical protein
MDQSSDREQDGEVLDRRWARRFQVTWPIKVRGVDTAGLSFEETGELRDLSSGGALIHLNRTLEVGSKAEILIRVPLRTETWMDHLAIVTRLENSMGKAVAIKFSTSRPRFLTCS